MQQYSNTWRRVLHVCASSLHQTSLELFVKDCSRTSSVITAQRSQQEAEVLLEAFYSFLLIIEAGGEKGIS